MSAALATRLHHETGMSMEQAVELARAWAALAAERGWTAAEVEQIAMELYPIPPRGLTGWATRNAEADIARRRFAAEVSRPFLWLLEALDRALRRWPWLYRRLGGTP